MKLDNNFNVKNANIVMSKIALMNSRYIKINNFTINSEISDMVVEFMKDNMETQIDYSRVIVVTVDMEQVGKSKISGLCSTRYMEGKVFYFVVIDSKSDFDRILVHELTHVTQHESGSYLNEGDVEYKNKQSEIEAFKMDSRFHSIRTAAKVFKYVRILEFLNYFRV